MVREVRVQAHPAPVAAAVQSRDLVPQLGGRLAVDAQIALAAKLDRGIAHRDADALALAGADPMNLGGSERRGRDARLRARADREARRQDGLGARQVDAVERIGRQAAEAPKVG